MKCFECDGTGCCGIPDADPMTGKIPRVKKCSECNGTGEVPPYFTPMPWKLDARNGLIRPENGKFVICEISGFGSPEGCANAKLIKVAPKMYEMLDFILEFVENGGNEGEIRECYAEVISQILREARGEE